MIYIFVKFYSEEMINIWYSSHLKLIVNYYHRNWNFESRTDPVVRNRIRFQDVFPLLLEAQNNTNKDSVYSFHKSEAMSCSNTQKVTFMKWYNWVNILELVFSEIRHHDLSSSALPLKKTRSLIGGPDRSANQRPVFWWGNNSNLFYDSDLRKNWL